MIPHASTRPQVVVVDDDPSIRRAVSRELTAVGFRVTTLASGQELLRAELGDVSCALIDVHLADMSGLALLAWLRARHAHLPVVLFTADGSPRLRAEAGRLGASAFLSKPLELGTLIEALRAVLAWPPGESP